MDEEKLGSLKAIIQKSACPVGCRCHKLDPDILCKARRTALDSLLECLEEDPSECDFAMHFAGSYYCKCTTRKEIARLLGE